MRTNSVILLESNNAVLSQLKEALTESKEYTILYAGDDGDEGIKQILSLKPDLVIVGMFLKGTITGYNEKSTLAFVKLLPKVSGAGHISEVAFHEVKNILQLNIFDYMLNNYDYILP